jgi:hypothetical protein
MFAKLLGRVRKLDWDKGAAKAGAFLSRHKGAGRGLLFAAGFALVVLLVHREVYSLLTERRQFSVPELKSAVAPRWADERGVELVKIDGAGTTLFDPELVARVGAAFEACPWIKKVTAVERVFPDQLRVRFEYRTPHVAVRRENGYVLVDPDGVRLPGVYVEPPACARSTHVAGVTSRPPEPGRAWDDPALRAGMELADTIQATALLGKLRVREVNVANFGGRLDPRMSELTMLTTTGCELGWGRTPATSKFGDLSTEEKLENLREVLAAYPDLAGLRRVKIYFRGQRGAVEPLDSHVQNRR